MLGNQDILRDRYLLKLWVFWLKISYYSVTSFRILGLAYIGDHKNKIQLARDFFFQEQVEVRSGFSPSCYIYSKTSFHLVHLLKII